MGTPSLWAFASTKDRTVVTRAIIERSRDSLLSVDLNLSYDYRRESAVSLWGQQARLRSLLIDIPVNTEDIMVDLLHKFLSSPAPSLESVSFVSRAPSSLSDLRKLTRGISMFLGEHPRLRSVRLSRVALLWDSSIFAGLTQLAILHAPDHGQPTISDILLILGKCPDLVDLELNVVDPQDLRVIGKKRPILLSSLRSLALYMPQDVCRGLLSLLDIPKLVRLSLGHDEPCPSNLELLVPPHIKPVLSSQAIEVALKPSLNYVGITFRGGLTNQDPETFCLQLYHRRSEGFGTTCNFVTSTLLCWDETHVLPISVKILVAMDPSSARDTPAALGAFFSALPNIVSVAFSTPTAFGYEGDVWETLYIFEETVRHGNLSIPALEELIFERMRFKDALVDLRHILKFRIENGARRPNLTFRHCPGIRLSEVRQLHNEGFIGDYSV